MPAPQSVIDLVKRFESQRADYRAGRYNETQLRRDFLDPFFEALGWDVANQQGYAERYREVIHEVSVEVEGKAKAADYAFQAGGKTIFFVEAKKPAVNIATNPEPAFQLRRYGWSAKLRLSLLTDFEQLAVYDCANKPSREDKVTFGRWELYDFPEYITQWDEIAGRFSRQAVLQGDFERYAGQVTGKKGAADVDDAFLGEIERWRELLARNLALRNPALNDRQLNFAVQMTIDRIVFLRICEERAIEPEEQLRKLAAGKDVYAGLTQLFRQADQRYNSGLFHFANEKSQPSQPDDLTLGLELDDKPLKDIIRNLYYPDSPYAFNYIPADILGQVYERFLGKVIRLTEGHHAKVEEKPEVRKAGGVYYTPTYIVDYIVQNTLGKLLEGQTPAEAARLKLVDPACGSGTFLLQAYQYLLDWHLEWYSGHEPAKWARGKEAALFQSPEGWRLTSAKKKEILLNTIHGVDIDAQAVEVTKLSLLLKVLEGESAATVGGQMRLLQERVLPDLGRNIQCGNSLIGPDYYAARQMSFDLEEQYRVNAFDWKAAFPQVFSPSPGSSRSLTPNPSPSGGGEHLPLPQGEGRGEEKLESSPAKPPLPPHVLARCRELRQNATQAEQLLWELLRDRQLGEAKFRRQHPLGGYILDFYCHEARLCIELDGGGHLEEKQARYDEQRTRQLEALGVQVLRFWNRAVLQETEAVLQAIWEALPARLAGPASGGAGEARGEGGFDVVIGNPPYIRIQTMQEWIPASVEYFKRAYRAASKGNYDI
ncbi:MAG TPA: DUF559 domain-containing protein, partial [Anaerolineales bacterium]|nr:DUF559 domain-containing protein [Anaerolineales bacterium]